MQEQGLQTESKIGRSQDRSQILNEIITYITLIFLEVKVSEGVLK